MSEFLNDIDIDSIKVYLSYAEEADLRLNAYQQYIISKFLAQSEITECDFVVFIVSQEWHQSPKCQAEFEIASDLNKFLSVVHIDGENLEDIQSFDPAISIRISEENKIDDQIRAFEYHAIALQSYNRAKDRFLELFSNKQYLDALLVLETSRNWHESIYKFILQTNDTTPLYIDNQVISRHDALKRLEYIQYAKRGSIFEFFRQEYDTQIKQFIGQVGLDNLYELLNQIFTNIPQGEYSKQISDIQNLTIARRLLTSFVDLDSHRKFAALFANIDTHQQIHELEHLAIERPETNQLSKARSLYVELHNYAPRYSGMLGHLVMLLNEAEQFERTKKYIDVYKILSQAQDLFEKLYGYKSTRINDTVERVIINHFDNFESWDGEDFQKSLYEFKDFRRSNPSVRLPHYLEDQFKLHELTESVDRMAQREDYSAAIDYLNQAINKAKEWSDYEKLTKYSVQLRNLEIPHLVQKAHLHEEHGAIEDALRELREAIRLKRYQIDSRNQPDLSGDSDLEFLQRLLDNEARLQNILIDREKSLLSLKHDEQKLVESVTGDVSTPSSVSTRDKVQFSLFSPRIVTKKIRYALVVYAYKELEKSVISEDVKKFSDELAGVGNEIPKQRDTIKPIEIAHKTEITVVPQCEGINFEPKSLTKTWEGDWVRYNFDFKVPEDYEESEIWLHISIRIHGIEVAYIKSSCEIIPEVTNIPASLPPNLPENPFVEAEKRGDLAKGIAKRHRNIFISYSHKDQEIAFKRAAEIERALGDKIFIDVKSLRAGDDWEYQLARAIKEADIFYMLWSKNYEESKYCRYEWDYALNHKCHDNRCIGVIWPVYWEKPLTPPPPELGHLHFEPIEVQDSEKSSS